MDHKEDFHNEFLDGNEQIEVAIDQYFQDKNVDALNDLLNVIRMRMHADGHFLFPVIRDKEDESRFAFRMVQSGDGKLWNVAFTSQAEFEKGAPSEVISNFMDSMLKNSLEMETAGFVINPWGQPFKLPKEWIQKIIDADKGVEYSVPDDRPTAELLEDGSWLKKAAEICNRNRTKLNMIKLMRILRDSWVWIPCNAVLSDGDYEAFSKVVQDAVDHGDTDSLIGQELVSHDSIRLVPDILQNGDDFYFPVFTSEEEMGEYGERFSKVEKHFLEAAGLAGNNEKNVKGIVINAFTEPFIVPKELFEVIAHMDSAIEEKEQ